MSLAIVHSRAKLGIDAPAVTVEIHLSNGLPGLNIVGLPETAVKESKDRVRSAIINSHFEFPQRKITINLAPADLPKDGGRYDLPIALGILAASEQIPKQALAQHEFIGELALTGELRPVQGSLAAALQSHASQRQLVVPKSNADEAALYKQATVFGSDNLLQLCAHLHHRERLSAHISPPPKQLESYPDLQDVVGQQQAKRALEIAAAGNHNLLLFGPPGTGKTLLASRLPGILPPLAEQQQIEVAAVYSLKQQGSQSPFCSRPFRNPHHTASAVALVGGGNPPQPGEISLAHHGVLFLDELPEFQRKVLEVLREPLESGEIHIARANHQARFPASFQLIAAMNPCPCGFAGDLEKNCRCSPDQIRRYKDKISGPLLDRIDMHVAVNRLPGHVLINPSAKQESSQAVKARVSTARAQQLDRQGVFNASLTSRHLEQYCQLGQAQAQLLEAACKQLQLSPRAYHRILKVARTIADLDHSARISCRHLQEAINYRQLDKT
jgi:magnesium chelatase family protein